jgi:predicted HNH restriction endonuclease
MPIYDERYLEETLRTVFEDPAVYKLPKGVIRYDYATTHGWWVRVTRDKAQFRKIFSEGVIGSIESALRLAIVYRHEILSTFPVTISTSTSRSLPDSPEQRIARLTERGKNQPYVSWIARWYDASFRVKTQRFSVVKFGESEARALALAAASRNHNSGTKQWSAPDVYADEKWRVISREDVEVLSTISSNAYGKTSRFHELIAASSPFGFEGDRRAALHISIERDKRLRARKLAEFLEVHGRLRCELCSFNFLDAFPFLSKDVIEAHHIRPLAELDSSTRVETRDLMLVCSNCHTAIHQGDATANLALAKEHLARGRGDA